MNTVILCFTFIIVSKFYSVKNDPEMISLLLDRYQSNTEPMLNITMITVITVNNKNFKKNKFYSNVALLII